MAECINREAVVKRLEVTPLLKYGIPKEVRDGVIDLVKIQPAADVAPVVHGRWISWEEAGNFISSPDRHECSSCHDAAQVLVNGMELLSDYCPNCGAMMDSKG